MDSVQLAEMSGFFMVLFIWAWLSDGYGEDGVNSVKDYRPKAGINQVSLVSVYRDRRLWRLKPCSRQS